MYRLLMFLLIAVLFAGTTSAYSADVADVIFINGNIVTFDAKGTTANAIAVKNGNILKLGKNEEIKKLAGGSTKVIDLKGKTVMPGFIDAHTHHMETMLLQTM